MKTFQFKLTFKYSTILVFILLYFTTLLSASEVKVKKDWFYVNNEKFFVKGIGYSNARPHEQPTTKSINLNQLRFDFQNIKDAGFNTIRTWKPLKLEELKIAHQYGLYVIQGTWIEYRQNYATKENIEKMSNKMIKVVNESMEAPNVLLFLAGNEPQPRQVFSVGIDKTNNFFKSLYKNIKKNNRKINLAISNWVQCDFLDDSFWDIAALNIYIYNPESVSHAMGYRGYTSWFKSQRAQKRPFIITEFGLSVSKSGLGHSGYGGNSLEEQRDGVLFMYKEAIEAGANGACVFEWIDEWWKNFNHPNDHDVHEPQDPEEWFGIVYYDEEGKFHKRPVFEALKHFNQMICISPRDSQILRRKMNIEVYVEEHISEVAIQIDNNNQWIDLKNISTHWFGKKIDIKKMTDGLHTIKIKGNSLKTGKSYITEKIFYINNKKTLNQPYQVKILVDQDTYYTNNKMKTIQIRFQATDSQNNPLPDHDVYVSVYEPVLDQKLILKLKTDQDGIAKHHYNINEEGVLTIAAGIILNPGLKINEDTKLQIKNGDCKHIKVYYNKQ